MIKLAEIDNFFWMFCFYHTWTQWYFSSWSRWASLALGRACPSGHRDRPGSESGGAGIELGPTEAGLACRSVVLGLKTGSVGAARTLGVWGPARCWGESGTWVWRSRPGIDLIDLWGPAQHQDLPGQAWTLVLWGWLWDLGPQGQVWTLDTGPMGATLEAGSPGANLALGQDCSPGPQEPVWSLGRWGRPYAVTGLEPGSVGAGVAWPQGSRGGPGAGVYSEAGCQFTPPPWGGCPSVLGCLGLGRGIGRNVKLPFLPSSVPLLCFI